MQRTVNGESCAFCCYGCCIAYQVKSGKREEWEAAWLLIRLGVGGFLSMNVMMFSLLLYAGRLQRRRCRDAALDSSPALALRHAGRGHSRRAVICARPGSTRMRGTPDLLGADRARRRRRLCLFGLRDDRGQPAGLFRHRQHGADAVHRRATISRPPARARAARDLRAAVGGGKRDARPSSTATRENRRPVREVGAGMLVRVRPGERIPVDGVIVEGESHTDEAVITGESRQIAKGAGSHGDRRQHQSRRPAADPQQRRGKRDPLGADLPLGARGAVRRSPSQRLADRVVGVFVPLVLVLGVGSGRLLGAARCRSTGRC